jgi:hypothetical protein
LNSAHHRNHCIAALLLKNTNDSCSLFPSEMRGSQLVGLITFEAAGTRRVGCSWGNALNFRFLSEPSPNSHRSGAPDNCNFAWIAGLYRIALFRARKHLGSFNQAAD